MRLEALELEAVGTFAGPVLIRDIAPGLNVLAGPNELGKSTLLRALLTLFLEGHRARKQSLEELRPYGGGAPRIACRFALDETSWRIEKQYLSAPKAELRRVGGEEQHIGADAETALAQLLADAGDLAARLPLFWVTQRESARLPLLDDGLRHSLGEVLASEAEKSSGGTSANAALKAVKSRLDQLVTAGRGQPKRGGPLARRLKERDEVRTSLARAEARAGQAEAWMRELAELQKREAELTDQAAFDLAKTRLGRLEHRREEAAQASRQIKILSERLTFLDEQLKQRAAAVAAHDEAIRERGTLQAAMAAAETELSRVISESADLDAAIEKTAHTLADVEVREAGSRKSLEAARGLAIRVAEGARRDQLQAQLDRLSKIDAQIAQIDKELDDMDWPETTATEVEEAVRRISSLEMRRAAAAPALKVIYSEGRENGFSIKGDALVEGEERRIVSPVAVDVENIGRIEIRPAQTETRDKLDGELTHWRHRLTRHLEAMRAASPEEAEKKESVRRDCRQRRRLMLVEQDTIAPEGRERIVAELANLPQSPADGDIPAGDVTPAVATTQTEAAVERLAQERVRLAGELDSLRQRRSERENRRTELATERVMRRSRLTELTAGLVAEGGQDPRDQILSHVADAERQINEARRERQAFEETALAPEKMAALDAEIDELKRAAATRDHRLADVRQDMRRIEGQLLRDFEDGPGEEVSALTARLEALDGEIANLEEEVAALKLLQDELGAATERHRREISGPLAGRLADLAAGLWPEAEIALTPELEIAQLARAGASETPAAVSVGTHEQLAVLARLAYADMLATAGTAVPVILDDPFVYSDDTRLDELFNVIADAATRHQIIILTCHARAFEPLIARHNARRLDFERVTAGQPVA
jgi:energy-coupling factor transporter ATP-binding protein EcfA2